MEFYFLSRRIVIHDCSSQVFLLFLRFIYTGQTGTDVSLEFLTDLIALADRLDVFQSTYPYLNILIIALDIALLILSSMFVKKLKVRSGYPQTIL